MLKGTFAVREQGPTSRHQYSISVVFRGTARHHSIVAVPEVQAVLGGNKQLPAHGIAEVVTLLRRRHTFWPCPLDTFITAHEVATAKRELKEDEATDEEIAEDTQPPPSQDGM